MLTVIKEEINSSTIIVGKFNTPLTASEGKEYACNVGDLISIPGSGKSPGEEHGKPTPVFLPGKFHGWRSLVGYCPWGRKESDTTERLHSITSVGLISISGMAVTKDVKR